MFHFLQKGPRVIRFLGRPQNRDVIAPPVPAKLTLPDWFRRLPPVDRKHLSPTNNGLTVKRFMRFLDAMTTCWILPVAATVRLEIKGGGRNVDAGWEFDRVMVSNHGAHQVAGNPREPHGKAERLRNATALIPIVGDDYGPNNSPAAASLSASVATKIGRRKTMLRVPGRFASGAR